MNKTLLIILAVAVACFAMPERVKSKSGDLAIMKLAGSDEVICSAPFQEELKLLRQEADYALVKALCAKGWVPIAAIERVGAAPKDKSIVIDPFEVFGHVDNQTLVSILTSTLNPDVMVNIDRNFRDMLVQTMDRESVERRNEEN